MYDTITPLRLLSLGGVHSKYKTVPSSVAVKSSGGPLGAEKDVEWLVNQWLEYCNAQYYLIHP